MSNISSPKAFRGCLVTKAADQNTADYSAGVAVAWDSEAYDYGGWHDNVTNNTRMTVPAGVSKVRVSAQIVVTNTTASKNKVLWISKNALGVAYVGAPETTMMAEATQTSGLLQVVSAVLEVVAGDYFEAVYTDAFDNSVSLLQTRCWMAIEAVE